MEDRGGEDGVGAAVDDRGDEVGRTGRAAGGDDRHARRGRVMARSRSVSKPAAGPVAVDRGHEQLAGAELDGALRPVDGVEAGRLAAALDDDLPAVGRGARSAARVDGDDDGLPPEAPRAAVDERRDRRPPPC